jgi:hypothetical protein
VGTLFFPIPLFSFLFPFFCFRWPNRAAIAICVVCRPLAYAVYIISNAEQFEGRAMRRCVILLWPPIHESFGVPPLVVALLRP